MTMTYSEAIDKLSALCESIMLDYEYEVITEATDENGEKDPNKVKVLAGKAWAGIKKVMAKLWEIAKAIAAKIKARIKAIIAHSTKSQKMILTDEAQNNNNNMVELHNFTLDPKKAIRVLLLVKRALTSAMDASFGDSTLSKQMDELLEVKEVTIKQQFATVADFFNVATLMEEVAGVGQQVASSMNGDDSANAKVEMSRKAIQMYKVFQSDYSKFTMPDVKFGKKASDAKNSKEEKRMWNDAIMAGQTQHKAAGAILGESATYADLMKFKAMLLAEAAEACDNAAHCVIDTATQKDIEDIPEEKPVSTNEYPTDTSGGEGLRDDNLEATKELVDDNAKAMNILTDDEGSETIAESIDLVFDL